MDYVDEQAAQRGDAVNSGEVIGPGLHIGPRMRPAWDCLLSMLADGRRRTGNRLIARMQEAAPDLTQGTLKRMLIAAANYGVLQLSSAGRYRLASAAADHADCEHDVEDTTVPGPAPPQGTLAPNGECRWCGAAIRWVSHRTSGERRPVDLVPVQMRPAALEPRHRNVVLVDLDHFLHESEAEGPAGPLGYRPHHAGCPELPARVRQLTAREARQQRYRDVIRGREDNLARSGALPLYEPEPEPAHRLTAEEMQAIRAQAAARHRAQRQQPAAGADPEPDAAPDS